jgi:hypothetical protein
VGCNTQVHGSNARTLYTYLYPKLAKAVFLSYYRLFFSSTKSEKRAEQVLPGSGVEEVGGGDGTSNVYTCK